MVVLVFRKIQKLSLDLLGMFSIHLNYWNAVIEVNNRQQSLPVTKAKEVFGSLTGKKVSLLGLVI